VYRLLGLLAPINQRLSWFRVNFIPSNALFLIALAAIVFLNVNSIAAVQKARTAPEPRPVSRVLATPTPLRSYVALQGRLRTDARIAFDEQRAGGNLILADYTWVPLADRAAREAILVQFEANETFDESGEDVEIEGIIVPMLPALKRLLEETNFVRAGTRIVPRYMLVAGRRPGSLTTPSVVIAVAVVLFLSVVWLTYNKNVVFMPSDGVPVAGAIQKPAMESLALSGRFTYDGQTHRYFTNVPGSITRTESGNPVLSTLLETSTTRYGVLKSVEHSGMWLLPIEAGSITGVQAGHVFWGTRKLRAIRFRFVNGLTRKPDSAVIASAVVDPLGALHSVNMA
jgi:hypothetical protein